MTTAVQHRRGSTSEHSTFTGLVGEVTIDTTKDTAVIHDGSLAGGYPLAKENLANVTPTGLTAITGADTASDDKFFIFDQSASALKSITRAELNNAIEQDALANVAITGGTINGTSVGATTPSTGAFTTLSSSSTTILNGTTIPASKTLVTLDNTQTLTNKTLTSPVISGGSIDNAAIGATTAAAGAFTTLTTSGAVTHNGGTANGVAYLNGSKVLTTGSALTFDGNALTLSGATAQLVIPDGRYYLFGSGYSGITGSGVNSSSGYLAFATGAGGSEQMRLTSTGLGIGTSSPGYKLDVVGEVRANNLFRTTDGTNIGLFGSGVFAGGVVGIGSSNSVPLVFGTGATERMRLDSSGNLGLGVTPSAWDTYKAFQVTNASLWGAVNNAYVSANLYYQASGGRKYIANGYASEYSQANGVHAWSTAPSGTAGNAISFTQAMTLDASGQLLLGTTTASLSAAGRGNITLSGSSSSILVLNAGGSDGGWFYADNTQTALSSGSGLYLNFQIGGTERARITSGGYFKASDTGTYQNSAAAYHELRQSASDWIAYIVNSNAAPFGINIGHITDANSTGSPFLACNAGAALGTLRAEIRSNGGLANYSANDVNLSDRREKTNFAPAGEYLSKICAIPVQTFNYIDQNLEEDDGLTLGVVAQDVQAVAPELVMESNWGTKENPKMRLSIYQTDLQYALMKCIQEQQAIITDLRARVAALEAA